MDKPESFIEVRVHQLTTYPNYSGLCVGYERGEWRSEQFASHLIEWIPEFVLPPEELKKMVPATSIKFLRKAFSIVYQSEKFQRRGEFGELMLHVAMRQIFDTVPAISKVFYKTAPNDTIKGFDAVHVVVTEKEIELWIGEAKFYSDINDAIRSVVVELKQHLETDYLKNEFALIANKIDDRWPHSKRLKQLLDPNTSLDTIFDHCRIPVLLTYNSPVVGSHNKIDEQYCQEFKQEIQQNSQLFANSGLPQKTEIHLFLLPLKEKVALVEILDRKLKDWQNL